MADITLVNELLKGVLKYFEKKVLNEKSHTSSEAGQESAFKSQVLPIHYFFTPYKNIIDR